MIGFYIPNRLEGEKIIFLVRAHSILLLAKILLWLAVAVLPLIFYYTLGDVIAGIIPAQIFRPILILFASIFYLYVWLFIFYIFVSYYLDVWIVTNERIINIEQNGLFERTLSEQKLFRVQDVTSQLSGFFAEIFDYGDVYIQTAGEKERFIFENVHNPTLICKKIINLAEENRKFHHIAVET